MKKKPHSISKSNPLPVTSERFAFDDLPFVSGGGDRLTSLVSLHTHPGVEFGAIIESSGMLHFNGQEHPMRKGDFYFVDAMIPHWHHSDIRHNFRNVWICMPFSALLSILPGRSDTRLLLPFLALRRGLSPVIKADKALYEDMVSVNRLWIDQPRDWELSIWTIILGIVVEMYQQTREYLDTLQQLPPAAHLLTILPAINRLDREYTSP